jgi:hypothetical protein
MKITWIERQETFAWALSWTCLKADFVEGTIPEKPTRRLQKYRLTPKGKKPGNLNFANGNIFF